MSIKEFHLFHGAVLAKLIRSGKPISLSLIETKTDDAWASYTINMAEEIYIKHSTNARINRRGEGGYSWTFVFTPEHISQIKKIQLERRVNIALVCGHKSIKDERMEICFLTPKNVEQIIDFENLISQSVTVRYINGAKKLRVFQERKVEVLVPLNELDAWDIPGR